MTAKFTWCSRHWVQELTFTNGKGRLGTVITEYVPCTPQYGTGYA